nr:replicase [Grapevine virus I]
MSLGASSQKVAYANLYANIGSDKLSEVREEKAKIVASIESYASNLFDYYVSDDIYDFLVSKGLPLSINCFRTHSHPISKMIENYFLFNVIGNHMTDKTTFVSLKEDKLDSIKARKKGFKGNPNVLNRLIHAKDALRYRDPLRCLDFSHSREVVNDLKHARRVIVHDEIHYWDLGEFQRFLGLLQGDLVYSVVYPAEIQAGYTFSLNPKLYEFRIDKSGKFFTWAPDGVMSCSYRQPIMDWLLTTNKTVDVSGRTWTLSKLETIGSHHVFLCTLGDLVTEDAAVYTDYTLVDPRLLGNIELKLPRIRAEFMKKTLHYLMALKKPDSASAVSKLRQLCKGDENADELIFSGAIAKDIADSKYFTEVGGFLDLKKYLGVSFARMFGVKVEYLLSKKWFQLDTLTETIKLMVPAEITIEMGRKEAVDRSGFYKSVKYMGSLRDRQEYKGIALDVSELLDAVPDRKPRPYSITFEDGTGMMEVGDPLAELEEFKHKLGCPKVEEQKMLFFKTKPTWGSNYCFQEVAKNIYIKVYLISNPPLHELLLEGLITLEEYTSMVGSNPVAEEMSVDPKEEVKEVEANETKGASLEKLGEVKRNICLIKPIADHFGMNPEVLIAKVSSEVPNFTRYLTDKGLSLPGFYMLCKNMKLTLSLFSDQGFLHIDGEYKPLGICIKGDHATPARYVKAKNDPALAVAVNSGIGKMRIEVFSDIAVDLKQSFEKGFTGLMLNDVQGKWARDIPKGKSATLEVSTCLGFAGSGKTSCLTQMLKAGLDMEVAVVSPRRALAEEWKKELLDTDVKVFTFENFFIKYSNKVDLLILDESPLLPPGYIDLVHYTKEVGHIVVLGDPLQTSYHAEADALTLADVEKDIFKRLKQSGEGLCPCGLQISTKVYTGPDPMLDFTDGDKLKGRSALFFSRNGDGYQYNGGSHKSRGWPSALNMVIDACGYNADSFDHCLAQLYEGGSKLAAHADNEPVYPIMNPILTVQLNGEGVFGLSCRKGDTNLQLKGGAFFLMPNGCQKTHKHSVRAQTSRVSLTFRSTKELELPLESVRKVPYMLFTNRLASDQKILGVKAYGHGSFRVREVSKLDKEMLTLCFSRKTVEEVGKKLNIYTVGQAQGLSRDYVQIYFDSGAMKTTDETVITALTRARKGIDVFYKVKKEELKKCASKALKEFLNKGMVSSETITEGVLCKLEGAQLMYENVYIGNEMENIELKLAGDPGLKAMLTILQEEEMEMEEMQPEVIKDNGRTHLALTTFANEQFAYDLKAKEDREVYLHGTGFSKQIRDDISSDYHAGPCAPSSIYLHHTTDDDVLFFLSIKKRLRFADMQKNFKNFKLKENLGKAIFSEFLKRADFMNFYNLPEVNDVEMEMDFTRKRIEKSASILEAHSYRSDPDWPSNYLRIFIKTQDCTKMEKRGSDAKAGQTIACFAHAVLCRFGPLLRRTEAQLRKIIPEHILVFSQKSYDDLNDWCKTYFSSFCGTDSDYEAFDRSQDGAILAFEIELLKHFQWPEEVIEEYKTLKLMMGCSLGDLAVMRFSGEFGTFFFNTMCNMAFTFLRYKIGPYQPLAFAGDDMVAPGQLVVDQGMSSVLNQLELKAKVNFSNSPLFCGWRVSPYGIVKEPNLLLDRLEMKRAEGKLDGCIANYALEASYGYRLCEHLHELNVDLDAFQELIRKIVMLKNKLPSYIADIFSDEGDLVSSDDES